MKQILIPTDFSENAWNALLYAVHLLQNEPCVYFILNVYKVNSNLADATLVAQGEELFEKEEIRSERKLDELIQNLNEAKRNPDHTFRTFSIGGDLVEAVLEMMVNFTFDYIVMGTKGATGAKEIFIGSNTVKVAKGVTTCPVMAVPNDSERRRLDHMVFATAFRHVYTKDELLPLIRLSRIWNSKVDILYVDMETIPLEKEQVLNKDILTHLLRATDFDFMDVEGNLDVSGTITNYVHKNSVDLVALIHKKQGFLNRLFREPVVKKVAFHTQVPFLILPESA
ncbi:MAG: universal stress protein [Saonia sp.]